MYILYKIFQTGIVAPLVDKIPLKNQKRVAYSIDLGDDVLVDDYIEAIAQLEVSNNGPVIMFCDTIILADSPTATKGIKIAPENCTNVDGTLHHLRVTKSGDAQVKDTSLKYVNYVIYAASMVTDTPLKVEGEGYGSMSVKLSRNVDIKTPAVIVKVPQRTSYFTRLARWIDKVFA